MPAAAPSRAPRLAGSAALLLALGALAACGPWAGPAATAAPRVLKLELLVSGATIGERSARFTLGAPLGGELSFDLPRCEWAGTGAQRLDRACVGTFTLRTPRGVLRGGARALWTGYGRLLALHASVRTGSGCFAGVDGGAVSRDGPVSFPTLPIRLSLQLSRDVGCLPGAGALDERALLRAARAADADASAVAHEALARALAAPGDEVRAAAAVALGFAAPDATYRVFRQALRDAPSLLAQAERTRELRTPGEPPPSRCDAGDADEPELAAVCAAARGGFDAARTALGGALASPARATRREAAFLLVRGGGARARAPLEAAAQRAVAAGDLVAAVDLAEALLLTPAR